MITVLEATYINTSEGKPPEFIGLWFWDENVPRDESNARLQLFGLDRSDILCLDAYPQRRAMGIRPT
jgi:hypothetical protein